MYTFYVCIPVVRMPKDVELKHTWEPPDSSDKRKKDTYFNMDLMRSPRRTSSTGNVDITEMGEEEEEQQSLGRRLSKAWQWVVKMAILFVDHFTEWLEETSALYREVVQAVQECGQASVISPEVVVSQENAPKGADDLEQLQQQRKTMVSFSDEEEVKSKGKEAALQDITLKQTGKSNGVSESDTQYNFDRRGDILEKQLHLGPSEETMRITEQYEAELVGTARTYTKRVSRLFTALYYTFLSHSEYVAYFFLIINIILNGSVLSLIFALLLYGWGLLSTPWPSKRFWLTLIFYSMFALVIKYSFQFHNIKWSDSSTSGNGLYLPSVVGIEFQKNFLSNATLDMLLLIALLIHRALLKVHMEFVRRIGREIGRMKQIPFICKSFFQQVKYLLM